LCTSFLGVGVKNNTILLHLRYLAPCSVLFILHVLYLAEPADFVFRRRRLEVAFPEPLVIGFSIK
jgi:hypothetical protein